MPRGVPKNGFRMTKNRKTSGWKPGMVAPSARDAMQAELGRTVVSADPAETEEQRRERIGKRFEVLRIMSDATAQGTSRSLIVSGPAGVGKSFTVKEVLDSLSDDIAHTFVKGFVRTTGLYKLLYEYRHRNNVIVFDDADSVFMDEDSLNMIKSACDTTKVRTLSWRAETKMTTEEGEALPTSFDFEGSIIFITNYDFDALIARGTRLAPHFEAMISRSHYLDLSLKSREDYMTRIKMVVEEGMLQSYGLDRHDEGLVIDFMEDNIEALREISLRMVVKLADLIKAHKKYWKTIARATCLRAAA